MPRLFCALSSLISAFRLCLFDSRYRRYAIRPWLIGVVVYFGAAVGAVYLHGPLVARMVAEPSGIWSWAVYVGAWVGVTVGLMASTMIVSVAIVLVFSSIFQTDLIKVALEDLGVAYPGEQAGLHGSIKEVARTAYVEIAKLLWLVPLGVTAFFTGLFPILMPITVLLISWLLAYQFTDLVLDVFKVPPFRRLRLGLGYPVTLIWFGLGLAALWAVPLLGLLLPPVAAVAAVKYLERVGFLAIIKPEQVVATN